ncbi:MAG: NADH-dependent dehydratase [Rhodobacteraceae bacterium PARR1]|nr:MAG: NADH-dependent dehydratase [Rhodobacteraceae bacterium PARR1]
MASFFLNGISRRNKLIAYLLIDLTLVPISLYIAFALRYGSFRPNVLLNGEAVLFSALTACGVVVLILFRLPWIKLSALEGRAVVRIAAGAGTLSVCAMLLSSTLGFAGARSVPMIFGAVFFASAMAARFAMLVLIGFVNDLTTQRRPVVIYGAGAAGLQMAGVLRGSQDMRCIAFIDDNTHLQGVLMAGVPVYPARKLRQMAQRTNKPLVIVAMPSVPKSRETTILTETRALGFEVKVMPSYTDMVSARAGTKNLLTVSPDAILGRDRVDLDIPEIARAYAGRNVLVTGAGGSIGSELCRQLLECRPASIVLFEQSEYALYQIDLEMQQRCASLKIPVIARLGSVANRARIESVMREHKIEIVLHAAAYKHVPLVEENELEGARNNVVGTQVLAEVAQSLQVERFILVSTDKAVRPTNIMGATKRMAELVIQDLATRSTMTRFAMVRFGNVLGSSGSVLPLFQSQIAAGGPVTVTHPDVTRFFMTIPEAARLVLLAGAYSEGGDVFVLDMGEPRRIIDIARQMIKLSGREVKDPVTGAGDIEIRITGLRPGEKLYEELLIDDSSLRATPHPKIMRAKEQSLSQIEVASMIREISASLNGNDADRLRLVVAKTVDGYRRPDADFVSRQKQISVAGAKTEGPI